MRCASACLHSAMKDFSPFGIEHRGGFVQHQDRRVLQQGAGQRDALALAAGEPDALVADHGVIALRQAADEIVRLRGARRGGDRLRVGIDAAVGDVVTHGAVEQQHVLLHHADARAQALQRDAGDVDAVDADAAVRRAPSGASAGARACSCRRRWGR